MTGTVHYDAYMSYSYATRWHAEQIHKGVQRLISLLRDTKPAALRIFRDETCLPATAQLAPDMRAAIKCADWFLYLACPESAESMWVGQEIGWWLEDKPAQRILIVHVAGDWAWDARASDFDFARSSAIHPALKQVFNHQPRIVDLTWASTQQRRLLRNSRGLDHFVAEMHFYFGSLPLRDPRFLDVVADIAAPLFGFPKEDLLEEATRRRWVRRVFAVCVPLSLTVSMAAMALAVAERQRRRLA